MSEIIFPCGFCMRIGTGLLWSLRKGLEWTSDHPSASVVMLLDSIVKVEFVWYWLDENGKWIEYGKKDSQHDAAMISSSELESAFLADCKGTVFFHAGTQLYELSFQEMVQRNVYYRTKRRVSRWPRLVFFGGSQKNDKCRPLEFFLLLRSRSISSLPFGAKTACFHYF